MARTGALWGFCRPSAHPLLRVPTQGEVQRVPGFGPQPPGSPGTPAGAATSWWARGRRIGAHSARWPVCSLQAYGDLVHAPDSPPMPLDLWLPAWPGCLAGHAPHHWLCLDSVWAPPPTSSRPRESYLYPQGPTPARQSPSLWLSLQKPHVEQVGQRIPPGEAP